MPRTRRHWSARDRRYTLELPEIDDALTFEWSEITMLPRRQLLRLGDTLGRRFVLTAITLVAYADAARAQTIVIDTRVVSPTGAALALGFPEQLAVGQAFLAPVTSPGTVPALLDFTFWIEAATTPAVTKPLIARVQELVAGVPTGPVLYESDPRLAALNVKQPFTYAFAPLLLRPGAVYAAYIEQVGGPVSGPPLPLHHLSAPGALGFNLDTYPGGAYLHRSVAPFHSVQTADLEFVARFAAVPAATTVPEPHSVALLATGLLAVGGVAARRKRVI
jgi:hypothetical protein